MKNTILFLLLLLAGCATEGQMARFTDIEKTLLAGQATPEWIAELQGIPTPIVSRNEGLFVLHAPGAETVQVAGDFTDWDHRPVALVRSGRTDLYYISIPFDSRARLEYQFIVDGKWMLDPLNERKIINGLGGFNSWFVMPEYRAHPRVRLTANTPRGLLEQGLVANHPVGVYLPAGYQNGKKTYGVQYFQDGKDYLDRSHAVEVLDTLIEKKLIPPIIGIFVSPVDRAREYWCSPVYTKFFAETLVPWTDDNYRTRRSRENRALMGDSLGGLISVHIAYQYPRLFGRVASQSGAWYNSDFVRDGRKRKGTHLFDRIRRSRIHPMRFYLSVGKYEGFRQAHGELRSILKKRDVPHRYRERPYGHNWTFWKEDLPEALTYIWK